MAETVAAPVRQGDLIAWRTWCGVAVLELLTVRRDGTCQVVSADGHSEHMERVPVDARPATVPEVGAYYAKRWPQVDREDRPERRTAWFLGLCDGCPPEVAQRVRIHSGPWGVATTCAHHEDHTV